MKLIDRLIDKHCAALRMENVALRTHVEKLLTRLRSCDDRLRGLPIRTSGRKPRRDRVGLTNGTPTRQPQ